MTDPRLPTLIINADDFGWTDGHNLAIERAGLNSVINSVSVMTTTERFLQAVEIYRRIPSLRIGVHLVLNDTASLAGNQQLPVLTQENGSFHRSIQMLIFLWLFGQLDHDEVRGEWRLQIERALEAALPISHLDSHRHIHLIPPLFDVAVALAKEYQITYVRLPRERFSAAAFRRFPGWLGLSVLCQVARLRLVKEGLSYADLFHGFNRSGRMTYQSLRKSIESADPSGITEIMVHPAVITAEVVDLIKRNPELKNYRFEDELEALIDLKAQGYGTRDPN